MYCNKQSKCLFIELEKKDLTSEKEKISITNLINLMRLNRASEFSFYRKGKINIVEILKFYS